MPIQKNVKINGSGRRHDSGKASIYIYLSALSIDALGA